MVVLSINEEGTLMNIRFEKASFDHKDLIFKWLDEPHMQEFWDNSPEHRDDIENFMGGRVKPSAYFGGIFDYWVGFMDDEAYSLIMTHEGNEGTDPPEYFRPYLSNPGEVCSLDFGIGNVNYFGKGLAAPTLIAFMDYFAERIEPRTKKFLIDPDMNNPRAIHVYQKAGFKIVSEFTREGGYFDQGKGVLMLKEV
jgi:RimJ/RimL family protein N-acetyltransferase